MACSHLQLSKKAPRTRPGLSGPLQRDRGSDALAPWKQQETDTWGEQKPAGSGEDQPPLNSNILIHTGHSSKDLPPQICRAARAQDLARAQAASPMH